MAEERHRLWYTRPSNSWQEALPLGNGRLGGMVYGGVFANRIQLNEDTLYSGPRDFTPGDTLLPRLSEIRRLIFARRYAEVQGIIESLSSGSGGASYLPLGEVALFPEYGDWDRREEGSYRRELDLSEGIHREHYRVGGREFLQECFCSYPDQVLVWHYAPAGDHTVGLRLCLSSPLEHFCGKRDYRTLALRGRAPASVVPPSERDDDPVTYRPGEGMAFCQLLRVENRGGSLENYGSEIMVRGAKEITVLISAATGYAGFGKPLDENPEEKAETMLAGAGQFSYGELKERHRTDHAALFSRMDFRLGNGKGEAVPTDERLERGKDGGEDPVLISLFFHYSRYLLIASSRPGSQPANLQGIWNNSARPPWTGNLTTNINVQMNYWLAEPCHLPECHEPLLKAIEEASLRGEETARRLYGCRGWCVHHGLDLWRRTDPSGGKAAWSFWPMAAPWLCQHLWDHYEYTGDREFLGERAYPLLKGAALFCLDWLVEDGYGHLVSCPSTSPENSFLSEKGDMVSVSQGSTMDMSLIWQLFTQTEEAARILDRDGEFRKTLTVALPRLYPMKIGARGQLQEWFEDFPEADPGHRHTAHLYALHPGNRIDRDRDPELAAACLRTLELRIAHGEGDTIGWCYAWYVCFFARLGLGDRASEYLGKLLANPSPNLLNAHRHPRISFHPMTIEANFGGTAGITELLIQSHRGYIDLLPALPSSWPVGEVTGLRARKGFVLDIRWEDGKLAEATLRSDLGGSCSLRGRGVLEILSESGEKVPGERIGDTVNFITEKNRYYRIRREP